MTRNEMKKKLAEMVVKAKTVEALELVQKKMEMLGLTDLVFEETSEEETEVVADTPWGKEGVSRGTYYRNKKKETETSTETSPETSTETSLNVAAPQRVINRVETENKKGENTEAPQQTVKTEKELPPIKGQFWLNPDGGELTWDDITKRMIFDTEDDARSACAQVGKRYLDYVWIQNPETKQYFTGGELSKKN